MLRLQGKVVVVTGGASGIGAAVVEKCLAEGAKVAILDLNASEVRHPEVLTYQGDVSNESFVQDAIQDVAAKWGQLDGLVNNAGIMNNRAIEEETDENWDRHLDINVKGMMYTMKHAFQFMKQANKGAIVNCSSIMAYNSAPRSVAYTVSKTAILGLTRAAAMDGAPYQIRVNTVCPGTIETPIYRDYLDTLDDPVAAKQRFDAMYPLGRIGQPEDVANMCAFLLSDEAEWVTGQSFVVDGGVSIKGTNE